MTIETVLSRVNTLEKPVHEPRSPSLAQPFRLLLTALDRGGVRYCHWKSNHRLARALAGEEDLDLLAHREDAGLFLAALAESGFKRATSRGGLDHSGVFHALALDKEGGKLLHVHAYFRVVGGDSLVKSYRLPVETLLLSHCGRLHELPVPAPEAELAVFVLRIALKHASLVEMVMANRQYRAVLEELEWLTSQADQDRAGRLFAAMVPGPTRPELFFRLLKAIGSQRALSRRILLGLRLAWRLRGLRRLGPAASAWSRLWRVAVLGAGRVSGRKDIVLETGGLIVALVGPKATGKSTLASGLADRLAAYLPVKRIHAGKPPATFLSVAPRSLLPLARRLFPNERPSAYEAAEDPPKRRYSLLYVLRMTLLAYDRHVLLRRSGRAAAAGTIVISDRYPSDTPGAIDSSCFDQQTQEACRSPLSRWLMGIEHRLHVSLPRPGLVLRLGTPVEVAIRRDAERSKQESADAAAVIRRWPLETRGEFDGTPVVLLRTCAPLAETLRVAMQAVWDHL